MGKDCVIFDCERMRYPNTGLYVFGKELVKSLQKEADSRHAGFMIYGRKKTVKDWGITIKRKRYFKHMHKHFLPLSSNIKLWHSPFQLSHYFPTSKNIPVLLTIHDLNFLYEHGLERQKIELEKLQHIVDRSQHIAAISQYVKQDIERYLNTGNKTIDVIYNGCTVYQKPCLQPSNAPQGDFLFTVGTILPKKNFHVLPCLLCNNQYQLVISGLNNKEYEEKIMNEARFFGVADRVIITGPISEAEKHWYYRNCAAFLFPSMAEGFGLPVIEAMYYQKPIFLSCHTCLPEIGGKYCYYFNREFDRQEMQEEFRKGMSLFQMGTTDIVAMRAHALSFSWENAAKRYWDIYTQFL